MFHIRFDSAVITFTATSTAILLRGRFDLRFICKPEDDIPLRFFFFNVAE